MELWKWLFMAGLVLSTLVMLSGCVALVLLVIVKRKAAAEDDDTKTASECGQCSAELPWAYFQKEAPAGRQARIEAV